MLIYDVRHNWRKKANYILDRPLGRTHYIFAQYYTDVLLHCGNTFYNIPAGGCILIAPNTPHRMECADDLVNNWIHLGPEITPLLRRYNIPVNTPLFFNDSNTLSDRIWKMETEFYSSDPFKEDLLEAYVREFLILLHRSQCQSPDTLSLPNATVRKMIAARQDILSAPEKNRSLDEMAALAHFSPSRFHTIYKVLFGTTPTKDLINMRINLAENLLCSRPNLTLAEVAEMVGYNDQYHLIRQFKTVTGQTPGKYRERALK